MPDQGAELRGLKKTLNVELAGDYEFFVATLHKLKSRKGSAATVSFVVGVLEGLELFDAVG